MRLLYLKDSLNIAAYKVLATSAFAEIALKAEGVINDTGNDDNNKGTNQIHDNNGSNNNGENKEMHSYVDPTLLSTQPVL